MIATDCWLAAHGIMERGDPMPPCEGQLRKVHLIPQQLLKRTSEYRGADEAGKAALLWDPALWVPACGGIMGCTGHHGMLDFSRRLRVPREAIPVETELRADDLGLVWYLDRTYPALNTLRSF